MGVLFTKIDQAFILILAFLINFLGRLSCSLISDRKKTELVSLCGGREGRKTEEEEGNEEEERKKEEEEKEEQEEEGR